MCRESEIDFSRYNVEKNGEIISKFKNSPLTNNNFAAGYVVNNYRNTDGKQETYSRHRVIWYYFNGDIPSGMAIDHINGDKTDNRLENLRLVSYKGNMNNQITREKMINSVWSNKERNKKISEGNKGKIVSEEQKAKQSAAMSGENHPFFGKKRLKQSELMKKANRDNLGRFTKK